MDPSKPSEDISNASKISEDYEQLVKRIVDEIQPSKAIKADFNNDGEKCNSRATTDKYKGQVSDENISKLCESNSTDSNLTKYVRRLLKRFSNDIVAMNKQNNGLVPDKSIKPQNERKGIPIHPPNFQMMHEAIRYLKIGTGKQFIRKLIGDNFAVNSKEHFMDGFFKKGPKKDNKEQVTRDRTAFIFKTKKMETVKKEKQSFWMRRKGLPGKEEVDFMNEIEECFTSEIEECFINDINTHSNERFKTNSQAQGKFQFSPNSIQKGYSRKSSKSISRASKSVEDGRHFVKEIGDKSALKLAFPVKVRTGDTTSKIEANCSVKQSVTQIVMQTTVINVTL